MPFVLGIGLEPGEVEEGGVEVEELDRLVADRSFGDSGTGDDHGNARAILPNGALGPAVFFAEMEAVVREENDDGVVFVRAGVEGIQEATDLVIGEGDTGKIGLDEGFPLFVFYDPIVGGCDVFEAGEIEGVGREIIEIVLPGFGELEGVEGVEIDPLFGGKLRDMWSDKSGHEEERLIAFLLDLFGSPSRDLVIGH